MENDYNSSEPFRKSGSQSDYRDCQAVESELYDNLS